MNNDTEVTVQKITRHLMWGNIFYGTSGIFLILGVIVIIFLSNDYEFIFWAMGIGWLVAGILGYFEKEKLKMETEKLNAKARLLAEVSENLLLILERYSSGMNNGAQFALKEYQEKLKLTAYLMSDLSRTAEKEAKRE